MLRRVFILIYNYYYKVNNKLNYKHSLFSGNWESEAGGKLLKNLNFREILLKKFG